MATKQQVRVAQLILVSARQVRMGLEGSNLALQMAADLSAAAGVAVAEFFGTDPKAVILPGCTAGKLVTAIRSLAQLYALSQNMTTAPVTNEAAAKGAHYAALLEV